MPDRYQRLLFVSDEEAKAAEEAVREQLESERAYALARKLAWEQGSPFEEDAAHHAAARRGTRKDPAPLLPFGELEVFGDHWRWAWDWMHPKASTALLGEMAYVARRLRELSPPQSPRLRRQAPRTSLGCRIGRRGPIKARYKLANSLLPVLCYWCLGVTERFDRQVDHKIPLSTGGAHAGANLCVSCRDCNLAKNDLAPDEFKELVQPRRLANIEVLGRIGGIAGKDSTFWDEFFRR